MITVFDNVFSDDEVSQFESQLTTIPWYLSTADNYASVTSDVYNKYADSNTIEGVQLTNFLFIDKPNSPQYPLGATILEQFCLRTNTPIRKLIRIKANLQLPQSREENQYNTPHVDSYNPHMVALYYANDSDACTLFFNKSFYVTKKVESKRGRMVLFSGDNYHAGQPPTKNPRIIINYNFI
jgi:hypothetical protein